MSEYADIYEGMDREEKMLARLNFELFDLELGVQADMVEDEDLPYNYEIEIGGYLLVPFRIRPEYPETPYQPLVELEEDGHFALLPLMSLEDFVERIEEEIEFYNEDEE